MKKLEYLKFDEVNINDFKDLLNKQKIREHLIEHELFDDTLVASWVEEKIKTDSIKGCKIRGIYSKKTLAGWCGIQVVEGKYEIAIVLDERFWGVGKSVFIVSTR